VLWAAQPRVERMASRVVHRGRADAEAAMDDLLRRMADALPVDEVVVRLAEAAGRNRQRAEVRVWLADGTSWGEAWPAEAAPAGSSYRVDVRHGGDRVGEIEVAEGAEPLTPVDRQLLDELAGPAGVALSTVRLSVDLQRREAELEQLNRALAASSERLRDARTEQRRRMRAEVGRRVVPHLRAATARLAAEPADPADARREAGLALDELRGVARGLHPPQLLQDGLVASLQGWMERRQRWVRVSGDPVEGLDEVRLRGLYFCLVTLLDALAAVDGEELGLTVHDDGEVLVLELTGRLPASSVPDPTAVQLARDRVEAFDGNLTASREDDTVSLRCRLPRTLVSSGS
jgi:hypothetical protein